MSIYLSIYLTHQKLKNFDPTQPNPTHGSTQPMDNSEAHWVWTVCIRLLSDSVVTAIWTEALLRLSPAR